jgi:hypothetical protein
MAQITNYSTLVSEVAARTGRSELTNASMEVIVQMAQERLYRDVVNGGGFIGEETQQSGSISAATLALPTGFVAPRGFYLLSPHESELENVPIEVTLKHANDSGVPVFYSIYSGSLYFGPVPFQSISYNFLYTQKPATLSQTVATNWFTANAIDALVASVLLEVSDQARDDESTQRYALAYERQKEALIKTNAKNRFGRKAPQMETDWSAARPYNVYSGY